MAVNITFHGQPHERAAAENAVFGHVLEDAECADLGGNLLDNADIQDWEGAEEVFRRLAGTLPRLALVWADAAYRAFSAWVTRHCHWMLEIVSGRPEASRFEVPPWRWIVERTIGWFGRYRRLSKDYETNPRSSETWIYIAMTHRMSRFPLPKRNRDDFLLRRPRRRKPNC
jgi:transposase